MIPMFIGKSTARLHFMEAELKHPQKHWFIISSFFSRLKGKTYTSGKMIEYEKRVNIVFKYFEQFDQFDQKKKSHSLIRNLIKIWSGKMYCF